MPRRLLLGAAVLVVAVAGATLVVLREHDARTPVRGNPLTAHPQYDGADPALMAAAEQAGANGDGNRRDLLTRLDDVPAGIWLTPERYPTPDDVATFVATVDADASAKRQTPVLVVYGVPDRDCTGGHSSGGLTAEAYLPWVRAIADAAGTAIVVLEPDALPGAITCGAVAARVALLKQAVGALHEAGVTTYVDAGHSAWVPVDQIADLLDQVGVGRVRGFSTNVSNYQPTDAEVAYAKALSDRLGGAHYVIDTGRNGIGGDPATDWCNPPGQALGRAPGPVDDGSPLDGYVWVKPPGESDGACHGGPAAGELWPDRAVALATAAGW